MKQPEQDRCPECLGEKQLPIPIGQSTGLFKACPKCHGTGRKADPVDELAQLLDEPRAVRLLAEWLAIDGNETWLEFEKYMEPAQSLYDYLVILRLKPAPKADPKLREKIEEIVDHVLSMEALIVLDLDKQKVEALKDWSDAQISANFTLRETTINRIIALIEGETNGQG